MEVTFFRHGIAVDRADPLAPVDFERPLTLDGKNKTESAARGLRALELRPALVLSSPFRRCMQSARLLAQILGVTKKAVLESEALAPGADPRALWQELGRLGREWHASQGREVGRDGTVLVRVADDGRTIEIGGHAVTVVAGSLAI